MSAEPSPPSGLSRRTCCRCRNGHEFDIEARKGRPPRCPECNATSAKIESPIDDLLMDFLLDELEPRRRGISQSSRKMRDHILEVLVPAYDRMTVRQVFYQVASVVGLVDKTERGYRRVQRQVLNMRWDGELDWDFDAADVEEPEHLRFHGHRPPVGEDHDVPVRAADARHHGGQITQHAGAEQDAAQPDRPQTLVIGEAGAKRPDVARDRRRGRRHASACSVASNSRR
jgi:hypothetical protein